MNPSGQKDLGVVVEHISLTIGPDAVVVTAVVGGVERVLWCEPKDKPMAQSLGAIAIKFSPPVERQLCEQCKRQQASVGPYCRDCLHERNPK